MLQSVTASQQCVSTRCDLWWGKEILRSLVLVYMTDICLIEQVILLSSPVRVHVRKSMLAVNAYTTEGFYVMW